MKIGDLWFGIKGEWQEFQRAAQTEGDKAGKTLGERTSKGFNVGKLAVTAFSSAAAGGFALAAKGAMELERVQGEYAAATGASTEEAKAFAAQVNGMRGSNTQSLQEIAKAGTQVAQQFKLTGEAGKQLTQDFLTFARVTHQDAAGAVDAFDKALDAFGEPASRATSLMDQLVASNQKFGTDAGPAAVQALADMAPALQAMGKGLDYGVGLLNLFEKSGIDAGSATMSLNRAVKSLKPGQTLDDLIAQLGRIEDPLLRGQEAMRLFGRGGALMANAIKPGMTTLADFEVSASSSAGTFDKAGDAMLTTSDKLKMAFEGLKGALAGIGQEFGPLATGLASLATLMAPVAGAAGKAIGTALGLSIGSAMVVAIPLALVGFTALIAWQLIPHTEAEIKADFLKSHPEMTEEVAAAEARQLAVRQKYADLGVDVAKRAQAAIAQAAAAGLAAVAEAAGASFSTEFETRLVTDAAAAAVAFSTEFEARLVPAAGFVSAAAAASASFSGEFEMRMAANDAKWRAIGQGIPSGIGEGMSQASQLVNTGMATLLDILKNGLSPAKQAAIVGGRQYIKDFEHGLHSGIPGAQQQAKEVGIAAIAALSKQKGQSKKIGTYYADLLGAGMSSRQVQVALEAAKLPAAAIKKIMGVDFTPAGSSRGVDFGNGLDSPAAIAAAQAAAANLVARAKAWLAGHPLTINTNIGGTGGRGRAEGGAVMAGTAYTVGERGPETFVPNVDGYIEPHGSERQGSGLRDVHVHLDGMIRAQTPDDIGRALRRVGALGLI